MPAVSEKGQIYRCNICGNMYEVLRVGGGTPSCCEQELEQLKEKTEGVKEMEMKHIPIVEETETAIRVKIGETIHPMTKEHHIEWIQIIANGEQRRKYLDPEQEPIAEFEIAKEEIEKVREFCNIHGLWTA